MNITSEMTKLRAELKVTLGAIPELDLSTTVLDKCVFIFKI
jgi:hypothetical protein